MSLFDTLKNKAAQAASEAKTNSNTGFGNGAHGSGNISGDVVFQSLPISLAEMKALPQAALNNPYDVAALTVVALCIYPVDKNASIEMLNYLKGPRPLTPYEIQFLDNRFRGKNYVPVSYFHGAIPQNDYEPTQPYTITVTENQYSRANISEGYITLHLQSGGADSLRPITLRQKGSTGQWFLWEQMLLSDIRQPQSADPWA